ncbi:MAG TPA: Gfo/Idh/MocA family oxidoreductase [Roseiflexaceae bacterium]|jgi:predicted dehydrogenase|nr:Gfo/Idh/MocA family oxidoreductase [Roseiflexaceae bacterium]
MNKVRWGVLSTANIGTGKVIPAMQKGTSIEVAAIASRNLQNAQAAAAQLGIPKAYGSYEELLADPDIDAIYNPLPNHLHVPWSIKAIEAGKHVLCEKPIALTSAEAQTLLDTAKQHPNVKVMEAFMYRFHPQWQRARELITSGAIGELRTVHSFFSYFNADPNNIRNRAEIGGGGLMDIGCYNISLSRFVFGGEPQRVCGLIEYDPQFNTDRLASSMLDFGSGTATFTCSTQLTPYQRVNIFGTTGRIEIEIPFNAPPDRPCRMWHQHDGTIDEIVFDTVDQYTLQGDLFSQAILNDAAVPTPLEDAVANMRVLEAIVASAKTNAWVAL